MPGGDAHVRLPRKRGRKRSDLAHHLYDVRPLAEVPPPIATQAPKSLIHPCGCGRFPPSGLDYNKLHTHSDFLSPLGPAIVRVQTSVVSF